MRETLKTHGANLVAGMENLANNARDQGFPGPGQGLREAFPDRADIIEDMVAEGDEVGMLWRLTGTHKGNFLGIPATGRKIDVYEVGFFRVAGVVDVAENQQAMGGGHASSRARLRKREAEGCP